MTTAISVAVLLALLATPASAATRGPAAPRQAPALEDRRPSGPYRSTHAGWTVWSEPAQGSYYLLARRDDKTKLLAAPASPVTHDPGAGRGPTGKPTAVYQRCSGSSCAIWSIDLATGAQRRVGGLGKIERAVTRASEEDSTGWETHPRIWGSRVAFHTFAGKGSRLRVGPSAAGRGGVRTIPVKPGDDKVELSELALGPKHVVAIWQDQFCFGNCIGLYITGVASGREQLIDDGGATSKCLGYLDDLRFDGSAFRWTRELGARESGDTGCPPKITRRRYDPRTGRTTVI